MLRGVPCKCSDVLRVDGAIVRFSSEHEGTKVNMHTFGALFESHEDSWVNMVTLRIRGASVPKETSFLTSSPAIRRRTLSQGDLR